jgi:hypothetical protein
VVDDPTVHFSEKRRAEHNELGEEAASRIEIRVGLDWQGHQFRNLIRNIMSLVKKLLAASKSEWVWTGKVINFATSLA